MFTKTCAVLLTVLFFTAHSQDFDDLEDDFEDLLLSAEIFDQDFLHQEMTTTPMKSPLKPGDPEFDHPEIDHNSKPCIMGRQAAARDLNQAQAWNMPPPTVGRL